LRCITNGQADNPPKVIDACAGTAGFLIEVMAYLLAGLRDDKRLTNTEREKISDYVCNACLYGIEANERVSRIARINMYLHGDGGSHIFHGDGLDNQPQLSSDMIQEKKDEVNEHLQKVEANSFDLVLSNPPFSMKYDRKNKDEKRVLDQRKLCDGDSTAKSGVLFLDRYHELLKPGAEMLIVLDDTVLNGTTLKHIRDWVLKKFVVLGVHSLPFNAFFKAKANIKTSILHLRKKEDAVEEQGYVFMSISNNIGHDNSLKDTPERNNLHDILNTYMEWQRTGICPTVVRENQDFNENLECPEQIWLVPPEEFTSMRFDSFVYSPDCKNEIANLKAKTKSLKLIVGGELTLRKKLTRFEKSKLKQSKNDFKYIEISDVTRDGLVTRCLEAKFGNLPTRGEYRIRKNDILVAINNSSRGTVVRVPRQYDGAICTSGFIVIVPKDEDESNLLWYSLRSESCRKQIYYLAQTASQPELKMEVWKNDFLIPMPKGASREKALKHCREFHESLETLLGAGKIRFHLQ
jgi:type I restriction enzyme M protein